MKDLLQYITTGLTVERTVEIYVDRQSLLEYKNLETRISKTLDNDTLDDLQRQQDDLQEKIVASKVEVLLRLPNKDVRNEISLKCMSDFGLTGEELVEPSNEFNIEVTLRLLHESVVSINGPSGTEVNIDIDAFRAFKDAISPVPSAWESLVEAFNEMVLSETLDDMEFKSADFS